MAMVAKGEWFDVRACMAEEVVANRALGGLVSRWRIPAAIRHHVW